MYILWFLLLCFCGVSVCANVCVMSMCVSVCANVCVVSMCVSVCAKVCVVSMCVSHAFSLTLSFQLVCSIPSLFLCYYLVLFYFVSIFNACFYSNEREKERVWIWVGEKVERK